MSQIIQAYPKFFLITAFITGYTFCTTKNKVFAEQSRSLLSLTKQYDISKSKDTDIDLDMEHFTDIIRNWSYPY